METPNTFERQLREVSYSKWVTFHAVLCAEPVSARMCRSPPADKGDVRGPFTFDVSTERSAQQFGKRPRVRLVVGWSRVLGWGVANRDVTTRGLHRVAVIQKDCKPLSCTV